MLQITINASIKSNSPDIAFVKDRVQAALTVLASLHEPGDDIVMAQVDISEIVTTHTPMVSGSFYTDTLSIR